MLRVFLATNGQSPIFRNLSVDDILGKLRDRDGKDTLASKLFLGVIDPINASNDAVDFCRRELVW